MVISKILSEISWHELSNDYVKKFKWSSFLSSWLPLQWYLNGFTPCFLITASLSLLITSLTSISQTSVFKVHKYILQLINMFIYDFISVTVPPPFCLIKSRSILRLIVFSIIIGPGSTKMHFFSYIFSRLDYL